MDKFARLAGIALFAVLVAGPVFADGNARNFAVQFTDANGSIATAPELSANDNLRMEALVRYDGPSANGGILIGNGSGCCNGWALLIYGNNTPATTGRLAILAGGVTIADLPQGMTLPVGEWQRVRVESRGQIVTVSFPTDAGSGPSFSFGTVPRNNLDYLRPSEVVVGQGFNGLVESVTFTNLTTNSVIESWQLNDGSGSTVTGVHGSVLKLTNTNWVRLEGDGGND